MDLLSESDSDTNADFTINEDYAQKYNTWRQKEEFQKLKDKYGDEDTGTSDSSSSESEDENAEELDPQKEKDWLKTLAAIKSKDPRIYKTDFTFYHGEDSKEKVVKEKKQKPMSINDYDRKVILEKGGLLSETDSDEENVNIPNMTKGYFEEQEDIKNSFKHALSDDSDEEDSFLSKRHKSKEEDNKSEEDYLQWLKTQKSDDEQNNPKVGIEIQSLKNYWQNPKLDENEKFLRDYLLNKQYLEGEDADRIPSYSEIVGDEDLSEEEEELEKQEEFEHKYNMRHEEPDLDFIKSYPRTIGDSVRRKNDKRSKKRKEDRDRKQQEKEKKMDELKQLKNLKKHEILDKIERLKEITGNPDVGFSEADMKADFDPEEHDRMMQKVFNNDYYDDEPDDTKPVFQDDEDEFGFEGENWDDWKGSEQHNQAWDEGEQEYGYNDDEGYDMETGHDSQPTTSMDQNFGMGSGKKKKNKKSQFAQAVLRKKPVFDPEDKNFEEYLDEYYKLDYEDIIGDMPCRFKYRKVIPNEFGLTTGEILSSRDKELNSWASLKRMSQYRTREEEEADVRIYRRKGHDSKRKKNVLPSLFEPQAVQKHEGIVDTSEEGTKKKRKKKKKKKKKNPVSVENSPSVKKDQHLQKSKTDADLHSPSMSKDKKQKSVGNKNVMEERKTKSKESRNGPKVFKEENKKAASKIKQKLCSGFNVSVDLPDKQVVKIADQIKNSQKKKRKKKNKKLITNAPLQKLSDERLKAYGLNVKKFKYSQMPKLQAQKAESNS